MPPWARFENKSPEPQRVSIRTLQTESRSNRRRCLRPAGQKLYMSPNVCGVNMNLLLRRRRLGGSVRACSASCSPEPQTTTDSTAATRVATGSVRLRMIDFPRFVRFHMIPPNDASSRARVRVRAIHQLCCVSTLPCSAPFDSSRSLHSAWRHSPRS